MRNRLFKMGLALLAGCAVVVNGAFGAYLPQLGPSPLRFRPQPVLAATVAMLSPLRTDSSASMTNASVANVVTNPPPAENLEPLGPPLPELLALETTNSAAQLPPTQPVIIDGTLRITPQMLVDFFKPVLNGTNVISMPVPSGSFTPPQLLPSSAATYKSN